jgi:hydroxymethylbilane synthase
MDRIRIGTRGSRLARAQARQVAGLLEAACGVRCEPVALTTRGDRRAGPLAPVGGKGLFTEELESALAAGRIELAVHSAKDLPVGFPRGLCIGAVPARADARDALVSPAGGSLDELPPGATVGTGSLRRRAQLLAERPDLRVTPVRGNVETRVARALDPSGGLDAVVLAMAGLKRSGLLAELGARVRPLAIERMVPAAGQGALVAQCRRDDPAVVPLLRRIDDPVAAQRLLVERAVLRRLGADCHSCVAVHVTSGAPGWRGLAMVADSDGAGMVRCEVRARAVADVATALLEALAAQGKMA